MSAFGWSYPPGCNGTPYDDEDETCEVCAAPDTDRCVCRPCQICGTVGDPQCYVHLHVPARIMRRRIEDNHIPVMHLTGEQLRRRWQAQERDRAEDERWEALAAFHRQSHQPLEDEPSLY